MDLGVSQIRHGVIALWINASVALITLLVRHRLDLTTVVVPRKPLLAQRAVLGPAHLLINQGTTLMLVLRVTTAATQTMIQVDHGALPTLPGATALWINVNAVLLVRHVHRLSETTIAAVLPRLDWAPLALLGRIYQDTRHMTTQKLVLLQTTVATQTMTQVARGASQILHGVIALRRNASDVLRSLLVHRLLEKTTVVASRKLLPGLCAVLGQAPVVILPPDILGLAWLVATAETQTLTQGVLGASPILHGAIA